LILETVNLRCKCRGVMFLSTAPCIYLMDKLRRRVLALSLVLCFRSVSDVSSKLRHELFYGDVNDFYNSCDRWHHNISHCGYCSAYKVETVIPPEYSARRKAIEGTAWMQRSNRSRHQTGDPSATPYVAKSPRQ
jgi:hypothetical protein